MIRKKLVKNFFLLSILLILILIIFVKFFYKNKSPEKTENKIEITSSSSNIIEDVRYVSTDSKGNKYSIYALTGEIDYTNPNVIFMTEVSSIIELTNSNNIKIVSDYGKYNSENFDTIFSKNVRVNYLDNEINSEYLDFSINRGNMYITQNVVYTNSENILKADIIDIDIESKDTKISMFNKNEKVNIRSKK